MGDTLLRSLGYKTLPLPEPEHPLNRALLEYWERKRRPGGPLRRADLEPLDIPRVLPGIFIAEPVAGDYRFRLAGSEVEGRMHRKITGATLMELYGGDFGPRTIELYRQISTGTTPLTLRGHYKGDSFDHVEFECLHLPIEFDDGGRGVLGGQFAFD